jgi:crotonobetainyl-CoA:carnitine CoA-transferase CaiB-like acyl-CoA transferase
MGSPRDEAPMEDKASKAPRRPLSGLRVVEFSHMVMGPSCGLVLGDLGADVIKVEPLPDGDNTRRAPGAGSGFFTTFNRNKRSLVVDLKSPAGIDFTRRLIATADVVTENFRPGALGKLGLSYETLSAAHPRLIYCSLKGFLGGPYEHRPALDEVVQMMGGLAYMTGPEGRPLRAGASVNDIMGGMFGAIGILAALRERDVSGKGQLVRSGLFENCAYLVASHMAQYAVTGQAAAPMPSRISAWAVYDVLETKDGEQLFVGVVSDTQWRIFCAEFEQPELGSDPSLATNTQRVAARDRLLPQVRAVFKRYTRQDAMERCERVGLPYAPIVKPHELFDDPQLNHPGSMVEVTLPNGRASKLPALPLEMNGRRFERWRDVPRVAQHSREIAQELGFSPPDIDRLISDGALGIEAPSAGD